MMVEILSYVELADPEGACQTMQGWYRGRHTEHHLLHGFGCKEYELRC